MTWYAEIDSRHRADLGEARNMRRLTMLPRLMVAAITGMVVLALIAEARLPPEQRLELLQSYAYPALP